MAYLGVLLITLANGVVLFFASLLAAGGDGSADGIHRVWIFGYAWIAVFAVAALVACARGRTGPALLLSASTLPSAFVVGIFVVVGGSALGFDLG